MIRIVICDSNRAEALRLRDAIDTYASSCGIFNIETVVRNSRDEFVESLGRLRADFFHIAICHIDDRCADMSLDEIGCALKDVRSLSPNTHFIMMSSDPSHAICAYKADSEFIQLPLTSAEFKRVIGSALRQAVNDQRVPFAVKLQKGVANMNIKDITFIETSKKGPIVHLPGGQTIVAKGTLQSLFDKISTMSDTFMRASGSFIVNLDNMRVAGKSSVIFGDGEAIILPVRARKPVRDAYIAYQTRTCDKSPEPVT